MNPNDAENGSSTHNRPKSKQLTNTERNAILQALLQRSVDGAIPKGGISAVAKQLEVSRQTVSSLWARAKESVKGNGSCMDVSSRKSKCGRKRKHENISTELLQIPLNRRGTIRSSAKALNIPKSTFHERIKGGEVRPHSNAVKPFLTEMNMQARLDFCRSHLNVEKGRFDDLIDVIHVDEKWFYMTQNSRKYYLAPDESDPHRTTKSKRFSTKVMFFAAVARPRWNTAMNRNFDGKIGIWPFVKVERAKRNSRNRPAGTLVTKPLDSVTNAESRAMLIEKLLPAIKEKFPVRNGKIKIQQDNARPHIRPDDEEFRNAVQRLGLDVELVQQPPNSPDLNVLDLGFFNAIQSLQYQSAPTNVDELVKEVDNAFVMMSSSTLNNVFLTLQKVMEAIILHDGRNDFKIPHMSKAKLERLGQLPRSILISDSIKQKIGLVASVPQVIAPAPANVK